jgi:hypothetical protein
MVIFHKLKNQAAAPESPKCIDREFHVYARDDMGFTLAGYEIASM